MKTDILAGLRRGEPGQGGTGGNQFSRTDSAVHRAGSRVPGFERGPGILGSTAASGVRTGLGWRAALWTLGAVAAAMLAGSFGHAQVGGGDPGCVRVIVPTAGGAYVQTGEHTGGSLLAGNTDIDYFGGGPKEYRNWLTFPLPTFPGPLVSAELRLPGGTTVSLSGTETLGFYAVTTSAAELQNATSSPGPAGRAIFADLGDGPLLGSVTFSTNRNPRVYYDPGAPALAAFNADGLAALTAAQGTAFAVGGAVRTLDGDTNTPDLVLYNVSRELWPIELVLNFGAATPGIAPLEARSGIDYLWRQPTTSILAGDSLWISSRVCGSGPPTLSWLKNGAALTGEGASMLYRTSVTPADAGTYRLRAVAAGGQAVTSAPVEIKVDALRLVGQPISQTVPEGSYSGISVSVASIEPLTYEWFRNGAVVPGQTTDRLTLYVSSLDAGDYHVIARNRFGAVTSAVARLTVVLQPPVFFLPLPDQEIAAGISFALSANVTGHEPITFRWYHDGVFLPGETNQTLIRNNPQFSDGGLYWVQASNVVGTATSRQAKITVHAFINLSGPFDVTALWGDPVYLQAFAQGHYPMTYQWRRNGVPIPGETNEFLLFEAVEPGQAGSYSATIANAYGVTNTRTAVVVVETMAPRVTATLVEYEAAPDGPPQLVQGTRAVLRADVLAGPRATLQWMRDGVPLAGATNQLLELPALKPSDAGGYWVVAANYLATNRSETVSIDVVPTPPSVAMWVSDYGIFPELEFPQVALGSEVEFTANVAGSLPMRLQWWRDGTRLAGETNRVLVVTDLKPGDSGAYTLEVTNDFGRAVSEPVSIEVVARPVSLVGTPNVREVGAGETVVLRAVAGGSGPFTHQWSFNGSELPGETNATLVLTPQSSADAGTYSVRVRNSVSEATADNPLAVRPASSLDHWSWRLPQPQGSRLKGVVAGAGRYVAVGRAGNVVVSTNGLDWSSVRVSADVHFERVAWGNGRFVATGYTVSPVEIHSWVWPDYVYFASSTGVAFTSTDGEHWTPGGALADDYFGELTFGNGIFLATSGSGRDSLWVSPDGRQWARRSVGLPGGVASRVTWGNDRFVALGGFGVAVSPDGLSWTLAPGGTGVYGDLTFGNGRFLAAATIATPDGMDVQIEISHSVDGFTWEQVQAPGMGYTKGIAAGNGRYVLLDFPWPANRGRLFVSTDLVTWILVQTAVTQEWEAIAFGSGRFVATGEAGAIATSADGAAWTTVPVANDIDFYGLASDGSQLVVAGDDGTIRTSTDGRQWTPRTTPSGRNLHAVAHGDGLFVAVGRRGLILTSPDGANWTRRESGVTNYLERVLRADGLWVAVGEGGDLSTSPDGLTWTPANTGGPRSDHEGIARGAGVWVAVGGYFGDVLFDDEVDRTAIATVYRSVDGQAWTAVPLDVGKRLRDVVYADGWFVAVGNDRTIAVSQEGLSWTSYQLPFRREEDNFRRIIHSGDRWIVVGNDGRLISSINPSNPALWQDHLSHTSQNLHDIVPVPTGGFVSVGNNGMILRSAEPVPRIQSLREFGNGWRVYFDAGDVTGPLRLEASTDLRTWETIADGVTSPWAVPGSDAGWRFFRLAAP